MRRLVILAGLISVLLAGPVLAGGGDAPPRYELDEIVVSADRASESVSEIPRNVSVVTSADIEADAGSGGVGGLVGRESGTAVRSLFGTDKAAAIDLRGMGETAGSNVVILVDGLRLNAADLSGPDLSAVPASAVESIEVVRGGSSVLYGDGAVGGVVNIVTRKGRGAPRTRAGASYGSFDTAAGWVSSDGMVKGLSYSAYAGAHDSDGYRDNGFFRKNDARLSLGRGFGERLSLSASGAWHGDSYGLPGPVSMEEALDPVLRAGTHYPGDGGESEERRGEIKAGLDLGKWGRAELSRGYRRRDVEYVLGFNPLITRNEQADAIEQDDVATELNYVNDRLRLFGLAHRFQAGAGTVSVDYVREEKSRGERQNSDTEAWWAWFLARASLSPKLTLSFGWRCHEYEGRFREDELLSYGTQKAWKNGVIEEKGFSMNAGETGLVYRPDEATSLFASFSTSFRTPNVDEFAQADRDLSPQKGRHAEIGARRRLGSLAELGLSAFDTRIDDEIYYGEDPASLARVNRNYDDTTVRRGVEAQAKLYPFESLYLWLNATILSARFEGSGDRVPLVAEHKLDLGAEWTFLDSFTLAGSLSWVDERPDGNDPGNHRYPMLDAYTVVDARLSWKNGPLRLYFGAGNLFDEIYSTTAYSAAHYPMPGRNFTAGGQYDF